MALPFKQAKLTNLFAGSVFLIAAHPDHLRFLSATFSPKYLLYLTTSTEPTPTFLRIHQSRDYVLSNRDDRLQAAISTFAMIEFIERGILNSPREGDVGR